jgi:pyruvate/oxaloacetate carboxyltransferase
MTQYSPESYDASFNMALGRTLSRLRDVTIRDGQQSWDSNRWSNADSVDVIRLYGEYAALVKTHTGYDVPPIEVSGGGEYLQPARFLGENPFDNLCRLKQAAPDLTLQSLYRGRQGFAFTPSSDEIQYYAKRRFTLF